MTATPCSVRWSAGKTGGFDMAEKAGAGAGWLCCPRCGGKTRTQIRPHTVLEDFPLFCPKCRYTCVIRFRDGKMEEIKMPDA